MLMAYSSQAGGVGSILVNLMVSQQHIEINLSELKGYEEYILVELIKERSTKLSNRVLQENHGNCRGNTCEILFKKTISTWRNAENGHYFVHIIYAAIILYEADNISSDTLRYIKWILERFRGVTKYSFAAVISQGWSL